MTRNRSLDEFAGGNPEAEQPEAEQSEPTADSETAADPDGAEVEPKAETFAWSPDGGTCARCDEAVEERWRDEVGLVCGDCKAW